MKYCSYLLLYRVYFCIYIYCFSLDLNWYKVTHFVSFSGYFTVNSGCWFYSLYPLSISTGLLFSSISDCTLHPSHLFHLVHQVWFFSFVYEFYLFFSIYYLFIFFNKRRISLIEKDVTKKTDKKFARSHHSENKQKRTNYWIAALQSSEKPPKDNP